VSSVLLNPGTSTWLLSGLFTYMGMTSANIGLLLVTITDALSHRTGMSIGDFYLGSDNSIINAHKDSIKFITTRSLYPFRE
jgi:hypothetical protein